MIFQVLKWNSRLFLYLVDGIVLSSLSRSSVQSQLSFELTDDLANTILLPPISSSIFYFLSFEWQWLLSIYILPKSGLLSLHLLRKQTYYFDYSYVIVTIYYCHSLSDYNVPIIIVIDYIILLNFFLQEFICK